MSSWKIILGGFLFAGAVIALEFLIRSLAGGKPQEKKWTWDKYDTITVIVVFILGIICVSIMLGSKRHFRQVEIQLLSSQNWPLLTPNISSIGRSPSPILADSSYRGPIKSEGYLGASNPSLQKFKVSSPQLFSSTVTPILPSTAPNAFEDRSSSNGELSKNFMSSLLTAPSPQPAQSYPVPSMVETSPGAVDLYKTSSLLSEDGKVFGYI
jgi:hypothetical protein